ncbi:MAG: hypothetical protein ACOX8R_01240 [Bacillota bacterium]|jgi:hypothetical protein
MTRDRDYKFAELKSCCADSISNLEKSIRDENGKEDIVLIAYEKIR